jgi:ribosomal-protein-alanine acetyltransferase
MPRTPPLVEAAAPVDLERLAWLEARSFSDPWSPALLGSELAHPQALLLVGRDGPGAAPSGYAAFRRGIGEAELLRLAVAADRRRQGLARALVAAGLHRLAAAGVRACHLEVRADNEPAIALYRALGFAAVGRRPRYYRDGSDALLFHLELELPRAAP